jgi:hypothetical protein
MFAIAFDSDIQEEEQSMLMEINTAGFSFTVKFYK